MDASWVEVGSGEQVVTALELVGVGVPSLDRLLIAPESSRYLRVEAERPDLVPGAFGYLVPGTRYFFNVAACRELKGDVVVALTAFLITHSVPVAATAAPT